MNFVLVKVAFSLIHWIAPPPSAVLLINVELIIVPFVLFIYTAPPPFDLLLMKVQFIKLSV